MKTDTRTTVRDPLQAGIRYGINANGSRLKILRPAFRIFVVEVLKATCVYDDLLSPSELMFVRVHRSNYAIHGDDMIVKVENMFGLLDIAEKLNLGLKI